MRIFSLFVTVFIVVCAIYAFRAPFRALMRTNRRVWWFGWVAMISMIIFAALNLALAIDPDWMVRNILAAVGITFSEQQGNRIY